jgi:hypothetical protein
MSSLISLAEWSDTLNLLSSLAEYNYLCFDSDVFTYTILQSLVPHSIWMTETSKWTSRFARSDSAYYVRALKKILRPEYNPPSSDNHCWKEGDFSFVFDVAAMGEEVEEYS